MTHGKKYQKIKEKIDPKKDYSLEEVIDFIKENKSGTFDEAIEIHLKLGINLQKTEQNVRGNLIFPYGGFAKKRIAAFVETEKEKEAKEAGAEVVGGKELIEQLKESKKIDFDLAVATPTMMKNLVVLGKILGPRGLMPSPKTGTITSNIREAIAELKRGKVSFKNDEGGNLHQVVGRISWDKEKILANIKSFLGAVIKAKPVKLKGVFIKSVTLCSTMGPGIRIRL